MRLSLLPYVISGTMLCALACTHPYAGSNGPAPGDIAIDSLSATRTAILRVQNSYPGDVRIYAILGGQKSYIAEAPANGEKSFVLDPNLFPASGLELSVEPEHTAIRERLGPYSVAKSQTIELVIPSDALSPRMSVHDTFR